MLSLTLRSSALLLSMIVGSLSASAVNCNWEVQVEGAGRCFAKKGVCSQYNGYGNDVCQNSRDEMRCDYNKDNGTCYEEGKYDGSGINPGAGSPSSNHHGHHSWPTRWPNRH